MHCELPAGGNNSGGGVSRISSTDTVRLNTAFFLNMLDTLKMAENESNFI